VRENELRAILGHVPDHAVDCGASVVECDPAPQIRAPPVFSSTLLHVHPQFAQPSSTR
jgi:hypothetical protein